MSDVRKSLRLPEELAARIDAARGREPWSAWVKRTLEEALAEPGPSQAGSPASPAAPPRAPSRIPTREEWLRGDQDA